MTNEDITVEILDKLGWDYDKCLNPNRYKNTAELIAGDLILSILNNTSIQKSADSLGFSYKVIYTAINRTLTPIFGSINGGEESWYYVFTHFIQVKQCPTCNRILKYTEYHLNKDNPRGIVTSCKNCRVISNAEAYKLDSTKESHTRSYDKNQGKIRNRQSQYKNERSLRTPKWTETEEINDFYHRCPIGYQVDHVVPLKGKLVSGLHVLGNLQYLLIKDNLSKNNKFEVS